MLAMLIAYDNSRDVIATLDHLVARDADGQAVGLVDFEAHELAGGELTDVWTVDRAAGSKTWPEWLGARAHEFRVELAGPAGRKRIVALIHKQSGVRREREAIELAVADRILAAGEEAADVRDLLGGPGAPLRLDDEGRTEPRELLTRPDLPTVAAHPETI